MSKTEIKGYVPGTIGRIAELHALYYSREWGFGKFFEAKVATELSEFVSRLDKIVQNLGCAAAGAEKVGQAIFAQVLSQRIRSHSMASKISPGVCTKPRFLVTLTTSHRPEAARSISPARICS